MCLTNLNIVYVASTLVKSGPTTQLLNIIRHLDRSKFNPMVVTLSPEPPNSAAKDYAALGVSLHCLGLSRIGGVLHGQHVLRQIIEDIRPNIVHSQGLRADVLMSRWSAPSFARVCTVHNYAPEDYVFTYGKVIGRLFARTHFWALRRFDHVVACSRNLASRLNRHAISCVAIQNGVEAGPSDGERAKAQCGSLLRPIGVYVGNLVGRKNVSYLVNAWNRVPRDSCGSLILLGDGPERANLARNGSEHLYMMGAVGNIPDFLAIADYFVSASKSEGLPMAVLEALVAGVPCVLSDIPSHAEIKSEMDDGCMLFSLGDNGRQLTEILLDPTRAFEAVSRCTIREKSQIFTAARMSEQYQRLYLHAVSDFRS